MSYQPHLFIGIGEHSHFFTLRETYLHTWHDSYGEHSEVRSHHHFNLSQDATEALAKAQECAERMGLELRSNAQTLQQEMADIQRATAEELARRAEREAKWAQERADNEKARDAFRFELLAAGIWPLPRGGISNFDVEQGFKIEDYKDQAGATVIRRALDGDRLWDMKLIRDQDVGLLTWWARKEDFETEIAQALRKWILENCADLLLPEPHPTKTVGEPGKRQDFEATVIRRASFDGEWGRTYIVTMVTPDGVCLVSKSGSFDADPGDKLKFKATVKKHDEYRGQAQTVVQRIKVTAEKEQAA